jgi:hypothetical protein
MKTFKDICQSCASPILKEFDKGRELNGDFSETYCRRCYQSGVFTDPEMTIEKMHEVIRVKMIGLKFPRFLAKLLANQVYTLKRWEAIKV